MPETKQIENNQSLKIQLSLASLMFFSPFVHMMLQKYSFEINDDEVGFIQGYMRLGWICIGLLIVSITLNIVNYSLANSLIDSFYITTMSILILILIVGCIGIFTEKPIIKIGSGSKNLADVGGLSINPREILLDYMPIYNMYRWYQTHTFETPNLITKESLLVRPLFAVVCLWGNMTLFSVVLIVIILRVVTLMSNINILPAKVSSFINQLFFKNPEELWGYLVGSLVFVVRTLFHKPCSWSASVISAKQPYTYLYDIRKFGIIQWQYALGGGLFIFACWQWGWKPVTGFDYFAWAIFVSRYLVMFLTRKHLPAIPGIREIVESVYRLFGSIGSRSS